MSKKINGIILGIRYRRSFRVTDIFGEIVDKILRDEKSPFAPKFFQEIIGPRNHRIGLINDKGSSLFIDIDNIVLDIRTTNTDETVKFLLEKYVPYIKSICDEFGIEYFNRVGLVFDYEFEKKCLVFDDLIKNISNNNIDTTDDVEIRFSKKLPNKDSGKKDINDFDNIIYTLQNNSEGAYAIIDFQRYFEPEVAYINDIKFDEFFNIATTNISKLLQEEPNE